VARYYRLTELGFRLPAGTQIVPADELARLQQATDILTAAEARAASIVADAEEAYRRECARGYAEGLAQGKLHEAERLLREGALLDEKIGEIERDLANVVAACVRKLIEDFDDHARAEAVVRGALRQMRHEKKAELRVSTQQVAHFRNVIDGIRSEFPEVELIDVIEDTALTAPDIILETSIGRVQGDFGARLAELETIIKTAARHPVDPADESGAAGAAA
jgi:type III secretion protein L